MTRYFVAILFLGLVACVPESSNSVRTTEYFDLDSLISNQVELLTESNVKVNKMVRIGNEQETQQLAFDSTGWRKELRLFAESDINTPILSGVYEATYGRPDSLSNLTVDSFVAMDEGPKVRRMDLFYLKELGGLRRVEILQGENNELYMLRRKLRLTFGNGIDKQMLSGYSVEVVQQLVTQDTVTLEVVADVVQDD